MHTDTNIAMSMDKDMDVDVEMAMIVTVCLYEQHDVGGDLAFYNPDVVVRWQPWATR
jgi:hypothetical protein